MLSFQWIKLYIEVLHDPKMGRLSDHLWRRAIEVFLLAGEVGNSGQLPPVQDMAWSLRCDEDALIADLESLSVVDITGQIDGIWHVVHFSERQAALDVNDRVAALRDRKRKEHYYQEPVTPTVTPQQQDCNDPCNDPLHRVDKSRVDKRREEKTDRAEIHAELTTATAVEPDKPAAPAAVAVKQTRTAKPKKPIPAAVQVYHGNTGRNPPAIYYQELNDFIGDDVKHLEFWAKVVKAYIGCGWNPGNVANMLDFYRRGEIPTTGPPDRGGNGKGPHKQHEGEHGNSPTAYKDAAEKWGLKT